jgi:ATP-dependent DNA helicase RecQ
LSCVYRFQQHGGMSFGAVHLIDVLRGKATDKVAQHGHERLSTFGIGADLSEAQWRSALRQLIALGYLRAEGEYGTLALTESSREVLRGGVQLLLRVASTAPSRSARGKAPRAASGEKAAPLPLDAEALQRFAALKAWRAEAAKSHNVPAFVVFHDSTLAQMARDNPHELAALRQVNGVGEKKLQAYGDEILRVLHAGA